MAEYLPLFSPGKAITLSASAAITAGQLVSVSGSMTVAPSGAGDTAWVGVASFDTASGSPTTVRSGGVQRIIAGSGGVIAGQLVHAGAAGTVVTHTNGTVDYEVVGLALSTAIAGALVNVQMER